LKNDHDFEVGDRVVHPTYGRGCIEATDKKKVLARFDMDPFLRTFVAEHAWLAKLEPQRPKSLASLSPDARELYSSAVTKAKSCPSAEDRLVVNTSTIKALAELWDAGLVQDYWISFELKAPFLEFSYNEYLASPQWRLKADAAKERAGQRCQVCNARREETTLDAHHRTYERIGNEEDTDLIVLCRGCHSLFHGNGKLAR
jgi:hypothetical protein